MIVSIHQPHFIPWSGYFAKILFSDVFVYYDDAQYVKNTFVNRNKLLINGDSAYITIPVLKGSLLDKINQKIILESNWKSKHLNTINTYYSKCKNYNILLNLFEKILDCAEDSLCDLNIKSTEILCDYLGIHKTMYVSSEIPKKNDNPTQKLIDIITYCDGTSYVSGSNGRKYLDFDLFNNSNIDLSFGSFCPDLSSNLSNQPNYDLSILDMVAHYSSEFILDFLHKNYRISKNNL